MSVYLGEYLDAILDVIEGIGKVTEQKISHINIGVQNLPRVAKDTSDRNRTSPIAFTGNKFEFRAVGSSQNCSEAATLLNLLVAYGYDEINRRISAKKGDAKTNAFLVMKDIIKETKRVRFEGNNYSAQWHEEAEKRGLPNKKTTPAALEMLIEKPAVELFTKYKILSERELHSKVEIKLDMYIKLKDVEFKTAREIAETYILPAVLQQINLAGKAARFSAKNKAIAADIKNLEKVYNEIKDGIAGLEKALAVCEKENDLFKKAHLYAEKGSQALGGLRAAVDYAETVVAWEFWPLAKYQDLLLVL